MGLKPRHQIHLCFIYSKTHSQVILYNIFSVLLCIMIHYSTLGMKISMRIVILMLKRFHTGDIAQQ